MSRYFAAVIVPVYNTPQQVLRRCLDSLLSAADERVQLIAVDDGSDEKTAETLEEYAQKGFVVYHKENGGVSSARNCGLDRTDAEYVFFADADDTVRAGFPVSFAERMRTDRLDVLISGITILPEGRTESTGYVKNVVSDGRTLAAGSERLFSGFDLCYSVRMGFRSDFIGRLGLRFREDMSVSEDMVFNMCAIAASERAEAIGESRYDYRLDCPDSATRRPFMPGYTDSMRIEYETAAELFSFTDSLRDRLAAFYMDFVFYHVVRNEKRGGMLTFDRYRAICEMPMFRESILCLGPNHRCENAKAQMLYRLRYYRQYKLPYGAVK
ncbi:MAG: glycosyltransferase family 2 protein [Clostridia bacterium]|nr:glycosyltransferase family 2 protein [Clostridia bacterium]